MHNYGFNLKFNRKLGSVFGLLVLIALLTACTASQGQNQSEEEPTSTPTPLEIPGKWTMFVAENKSHERDGVLVTVKQLRFGTTDRMFPDATDSELTELGLGGAKGVVGAFMEIQNKNVEPVEIFPGDDTASLLLGSGEQSSPIRELSNVGRSIRGGNSRTFLVVFPIFDTELGDIREARYTFDNREFSYTELPDFLDPRG